MEKSDKYKSIIKYSRLFFYVFSLVVFTYVLFSFSQENMDLIKHQQWIFAFFLAYRFLEMINNLLNHHPYSYTVTFEIKVGYLLLNEHVTE